VLGIDALFPAAQPCGSALLFKLFEDVLHV
jgi:hypothetical protein